MSDRNFRQMLEAKWSGGSFVCVGLDSEFNKIPQVVQGRAGDSGTEVQDIVTAFNREIVVATKSVACAYKINPAFYESKGEEGRTTLGQTIRDINELAPDVPVIFDAKQADIGNTSAEYAKAAFDCLGVDAVTVNPYLGAEALRPFLTRAEKGIIVLCRTSNLGAGEFQDLSVVGGEPLYRFVARQVAKEWNYNNNCAVVAPATYPAELQAVRDAVGNLPILIPGIGAQGGDLKKVVEVAKDSRGQGMLISLSRAIIFASGGDDFAVVAASEAKKTNQLINQYR